MVFITFCAGVKISLTPPSQNITILQSAVYHCKVTDDDQMSLVTQWRVNGRNVFSNPPNYIKAEIDGNNLKLIIDGRTAPHKNKIVCKVSGVGYPGRNVTTILHIQGIIITIICTGT